MNIPTSLANQLIHYLQKQAEQDDFEAQTLLEQIQRAASESSDVAQQPMSVSPDSLELGC
jgi:hypothetical protein